MSDLQQQLNKMLAGGFLEGGWQALNGETGDQASYEAALAEWEVMQTIARPFMEPAGQQALAALRSKTIGLSSWKVDDLGLINAIGYGIFREGQNALVRYIEQCMAAVAEGPPPAPTQEA